MTRKSIKSILLNIDVAIASIAMCALVACTFAGVIARYILGKPFGWTEEVQAALIVWVIFGAAGAAFRTANHAAIEIFYDMFPKPIRMMLRVFIAFVTIATLSFLAYACMDYLQLFITTGRTTSVLNISYLTIYCIVPVSCIWQIINFLLVSFTDYTEQEVLETIFDEEFKEAKQIDE